MGGASSTGGHERATVRAEGGGEETRDEDGGHAIEEGGAGAERDEREHVEAAVRHRGSGADEERPARPQDDRGAEQQLDPVRRLLADQVVKVEEVAAHLEHEHRQRQRGADPETPGHVAQFGTRPLIFRGDHGLQRHAADRAMAGAPLAHVGMHRAGVLDLGLVGLGHRLRSWCLRGMPPAERRRSRLRRVRMAAMLALHHRAVGHHVRRLRGLGGRAARRHAIAPMFVTGMLVPIFV